MKKLFIGLLLLITNFIPINHVKASHLMGGDLEYEVIDSVNRVYRIRFILYRDCSGINMAPSINVDFTSSNGCSIPSIVINAKPQPPTNTLAVEVTPLCNPKPLTTCSGGSTIKGTQRFLFEAIVTFPPGCGVVTAHYTDCCRNVNNGPGSITTLSPSSATNTWLEAQINTDAKRGNNSVKFLNPPIPYICAGNLFRYNHYAIDEDGDSLVYTLYAPYTGPNQAGVIYNPPLSAQKPFDMVESQIVFDQKTGQFQFTPTTPQTSIMGFLVKEYRKIKGSNGKDSVIFMGSTVRDVQITITGPCVPIKFNGILKDSVKNGTWIDSLNVNVCKTGKPLSFTWRINTSGLPLDVKLYASMLGVDPAWTDSFYSFTYYTKKDSNLLFDTLWGTFRYNTPPAKIGCYPLIFNYGYCSGGFPISGSFNTNICFKDNTYTDRDTVYFCDGGIPPQVNVFGGDTFTWSPVSGIVWHNSNWSSVKLSSPISTRYIVTSNLQTLSCKNKDTVELISIPKFAYTILPKVDTICQNQPKSILITLSPAQSPYIINWINSTNLFDPISLRPTRNIVNPVALPNITTDYIVDMKSKFECIIRDTVRIVVGGPIVDTKDTSNRSKVCIGDTTKVKVEYVIPKVCGQSTLLCDGPTSNVGYPGSVGFFTYPASTSQNCAINCYPSIFGGDNPSGSSKHRVIYKKSELNSMGFKSGIIKSLTLTVLNLDKNVYNNFTIRMGCINTTNASDNTILFDVYNTKTVNINANSDNIFNFDNNFNWDGYSNILIEFVFNNGNRSGNTQLNTRSTLGIGLNEVAYYIPTSTNVNADTIYTPTGFSNRKPMIKFAVCNASPWSPGLKIKWISDNGNPISNDTSRTTNVTINNPGLFTSIVSGGYNCIGNGSVFIDIDTTFKPKASNDTFICNNASIQLNITGNLGSNPASTTYLWSSNPVVALFPNNTVRNPIVFITNSTTFYVQIKNGPCISYDTVVVTKQPNIPIDFTFTDPYCTSSTGYIKAVPPGDPKSYTYQWKKGVTPIITGTKQDTLVNLSSGIYNLTITNSSGCTGISSKTLVSNIITLGLDTINKHISCFGENTGEIKIKVNSGSPILPTLYTYSWNPSVVGDTFVKNLWANVLYSVTVTDTTTGCVGLISVKLSQPDKLELDLDSFGIKCFGLMNGSIRFNAKGGVRLNSTIFNWSNGVLNGNTVLSSINGMSSGKYYVTITDDNGCKAYDSTSINQPPLLNINLSKRDASSKGSDDGMALCLPTGGTSPYTFNWNKLPNSFGYPFVRNGMLLDSISKLIGNSVSKGWYYVNVTDDSGCVVFDSIKINDVNCKLGASFIIDSIRCFGEKTGKVSILALDTINKSSTYMYKFNLIKFNSTDTNRAASVDDKTPGVITNLESGYYRLYIETNKGCDTLYDSLFIKQSPKLNIDLVVKSISCYKYKDGGIISNVNGGTPPYTYNWININRYTNSVSGLGSGNYTVRVSDKFNCVSESTGVISEPNQFTISTIEKRDISCYNLNDGRISISANGGTKPYTYLWWNITPQRNTSTIDELSKGDYEVISTDSNGCKAFSKFTILRPENLKFEKVFIDSVTCPNSNDGIIDIYAIGGTININKLYEYSIDGINYKKSGKFTNLKSGRYSIFVKDNNGCLIKQEVDIFEPERLFIDIIPNDTLIDFGKTLSLYLSKRTISGNIPRINSLKWYPFEGISCDDCESPIVETYRGYKKYTLVYNYLNNCQDTTYNFIRIKDPLDVFIPTAFTPGNLDNLGINDEFKVYGNFIKRVNLCVFNRIGEKLFESNSIDIGWDGTYKGEMQSPGVYVWMANIEYLNGKKIDRKGSVTLIR